jgi:hypothetical protein
MLGKLAPGDMVTVTRIDRLARSTFDLFGIVKHIVDAKAQFRSLAEPWADTGTSTGRLMLAVLGGLADVERDLIRTRTAEGRSRAKAQGKAMGREHRLNRKRPPDGARRALRCRNWPTATTAASPPWPEVTNGPFLSHKGTERERRYAGVAEFRRERRLSLRTALTGNRWFSTGCATTLQIAENWQPIVSLGHHASPVPPMSAYA